MKQRLLTASPLILIVYLAFALPGWWGGVFFLLLAAGMMVGGSLEAFRLLGLPSRKSYKIIAIVFSLLLILNAILFSKEPLASSVLDIMLIGLFMLASMINTLCFTPDKENVCNYVVTLGIFLYIVWALSSLAKIYFFPENEFFSGREMLLFFIVVTKMADVGAYFVGTLTSKLPWGNHKLAPLISPKKSYEGLAGGILFAVGTSFIWELIHNLERSQNSVSQPISQLSVSFSEPVFLFNFVELACFGVVAAVFGLFGDLTESVLKRASQQKDSGKIPGIGGILDVLDSIIPIAPLFYAYVLLKLLACISL